MCADGAVIAIALHAPVGVVETANGDKGDLGEGDNVVEEEFAHFGPLGEVKVENTTFHILEH